MKEISFEKRTEEFMKPVIKTESQFWDIFNDSKNQFSAIRLMAYKLNDKELIEKNKTIEYLPFLKYLEKTKISMTNDFLENKHVKMLIRTYDDLVERIKVVTTREEFNQITEEVDTTMDTFNLGIEK